MRKVLRGGAYHSLTVVARKGARYANARTLILTGAAVLLAGCGRYADFTLPVLPVNSGRVEWVWNAQPKPVLARGSSGAWDSVDVLNPSVVAWKGELLNFYSGFDGTTWHTGVAFSRNGLVWNRRTKVLSPDASTWEGSYIAANGTALPDRDEIFYWYQAGSPPRIGLARSSNGETWDKLAQPVLSYGPRGSWDERGVGDPYVLRVDGELYMYYLGQDRARRQRLGVARSSDGTHWQKLRSNPVLELGERDAFDETGLGEPAVWQELGSYWMLYTGRDRSENRRIGLARSQDGVVWTRVDDQPVFSGSEEWNGKVVCDPTVLQGTQPLRVWYGGGDRPEPAEHLNGQIGYATLRLTLAK